MTEKKSTKQYKRKKTRSSLKQFKNLIPNRTNNGKFIIGDCMISEADFIKYAYEIDKKEG